MRSKIIKIIFIFFPGRYVERLKTDQFLLSRANQLMGCLINKVASSSMMRMYLTLQGLDTKKIESPHGYRLKFVPEVSEALLIELEWVIWNQKCAKIINNIDPKFIEF